jgi:hypothetical protein
METLAMGNEKMVILVNPNHDRTYKDCLRGTEFVFGPLVKYRVPQKTADELLLRAGDSVNNTIMQHNAERTEYMRLASHKEESLKAQAGKFVDEKGNPVTKLWVRPPLVDFDNQAGRIQYEAGCAAAKIAGIAIPEEEEEKKGTLQIEYIASPKQGWARDKLVTFIEDAGGLASATEPEERLVRKAQNLYAAKVKTLAKFNVQVVDPEVRKAELGLSP